MELTEAEAAKKFSEKDEVVVVGFFEDLESEGALAFKAVAEMQDSLAFGVTSSQEVADSLDATLDSVILFKQVGKLEWFFLVFLCWCVCYSLSFPYYLFSPSPPLLPLSLSPSPPSLSLSLSLSLYFSQFDDRRVVYEGKFVSEDIESFIVMEQLPLVTVFSDDVGVA